jgi:hypothetical protein
MTKSPTPVSLHIELPYVFRSPYLDTKDIVPRRRAILTGDPFRQIDQMNAFIQAARKDRMHKLSPHAIHLQHYRLQSMMRGDRYARAPMASRSNNRQQPRWRSCRHAGVALNPGWRRQILLDTLGLRRIYIYSRPYELAGTLFVKIVIRAQFIGVVIKPQSHPAQFVSCQTYLSRMIGITERPDHSRSMCAE